MLGSEFSAPSSYSAECEHPPLPRSVSVAGSGGHVRCMFCVVASPHVTAVPTQSSPIIAVDRNRPIWVQEFLAANEEVGGSNPL